MTPENKNINILFVTQEDPFYVQIFFEEFLKNYADIAGIKGVIIGRTLGKKSYKAFVLQMFDFFGPVGFTIMGAKYFWRKVMSYVSKLIPISKCYSLEQLFANYGIRCYKRTVINSQGFIEEWTKQDIDLIISVASSVIFKKPLIELPKMGCINIHHGLLPKYRGMLPNFWQMYNDEKSAGITIHRINLKIDDGEIILQEGLEILPGESLDQLIRKSKKMGAGLMIQAISQIKSGQVKMIQNDPLESSYYTFPNRNQVKEFIRRGKRIL